MELEQDNNPLKLEQCDENKLIQLIINTFRGRTQQEVRQAQKTIIRALNTPGVLPKFIGMLTSPTEPQPNFKKAIALIIKKYTSDCAKLSGDKSHLMNYIYTLLMTNQLQFAAKDVLGTALEHLLNADNGEYRRILLEKVIDVMNSQNSLSMFDGCLIALNAYFNTIKNIDDQLQFFNWIVQPVCLTALHMLRQINSMPFESFQAHDKPIMDKISKLFTFFESMLENIFEMSDQYIDQIKQIRQNAFLQDLLQCYLLLFHNNYSVISKIYNPANEIKRIIMNIVVIVYKYTTCPVNLFKIIFITFINESERIVDDFEVQAVLIKCIDILDDSLERKQYLDYFGDKRLEIMFALLLYSVTNLEQYQLIEESPQKFVQIAQDYTQTNNRSDYLKVKAGAMLQIFIQKIDQALKTLVNVVIMLCSQIVVPQNKIVVPQIGQSFGKYMFYRLSDELKLETGFMVLSNLSVYINRRNDLSKLVASFLVSHFNNLIDIKSHLVILRLMRTISYYPSAIYFLYIETQLNQGKVFILEGIKSFERILKKNKHPELFDLLAKIISNLMGVIHISDPIMELIVINYYETLLKKSSELYFRCLNKIKQEFYINKDLNQHATLICFNLIYSLLKKQKQEQQRNQILFIFYEIVEHLQQPQYIEAYKKYEQKLFQIFDLILDIRSFTSEQIQSFVENSMKYLSRHQKGSVIFKMYNNYIVKMEGAVFKLENCFQKFWEEVKQRVKLSIDGQDSLPPIAYYCLLMSQIIASNMQVNLNSDDLDEILHLANRLPTHYKQYPLLIFLSFANQMPHQAVSYLHSKGIYQGFLQEVTKVHFQGKLPKKIIILALIRLIELQQQFQAFKIIMEYCVTYLKQQHQKSKRPPLRVTSYQVRPRRLGQERLVKNQEAQEQQQDDNELINIFVNFKHPYRNLSQYDNFKVILTHRHGFLNQLNEQLIRDIKNILETQWVDNSKTRRIIRVVK